MLDHNQSGIGSGVAVQPLENISSRAEILQNLGYNSGKAQRIKTGEKQKMKRTKWIAFLCFAFLMAGLGANDALRGIFAPVFQERYDLREPAFVDCYYQLCGNLLFLSIGGKLLDQFPERMWLWR